MGHDQGRPREHTAGGRLEAGGHSSVLVILGLILAGALGLLALITTGSGEPFALAVLFVLAVVGVFFLFGIAADFIRLHDGSDQGDLALAMTDASSDGFRVTGADATIVYANTAFRDVVGTDASGELKTLEQWVAGEPHAAEALFRLARAADARQPLSERFRLRVGPGQDRKARWYRLSVAPMDGPPRDGRREPLILWRLTDITAQKAREAEIQRHSSDLAARLDRLPVGVLATDHAMRVATINATLRGWLGIDAADEEVSALELADLISPAGLAHLHKVVAGDASADAFDADLIGRHGRPVPVRLEIGAEHVTGDTAAASAGLCLLVQPRAVDGLDEAITRALSTPITAGEGELTQYVAAAPFGIATIAANGRLLSSNPAFARMFFTDGKRRVATVAGLLPGAANRDARDLFNEALAKVCAGTSLRAPVDITFGARGEHNRQIMILPMREAGATPGEVNAVIVYAIDTTEQKQLEQKFAQSQKMEAVGKLAGGIAHDFNNVLTVIIGLSDLFLQTRRPTDAGYQDITQIKNNAQRAADLVGQLLAFSRKQTLSSAVLSLNDVVTDTVHSLKNLIGETIEVKTMPNRDLWLVKADKSQIEQVIWNLTVNARDAMPDGGQLTYRTKNITERESAKLSDQGMAVGQYVLFEVADSGTGMPPEVVKQIFEPFFSTKDVGKGTGLGLSTVYGIVKQTGGYIFADSTPGKGTRFSVYLPRFDDADGVVAAQKAAQEPRELPRDLTGSGRVLLVEDEDAVRGFASRALKRQGYEVLEAASGVEALEVFGAHAGNVDIVVSDVVMPEMDGPTLLTELRKSNPDLKMIFVSGYPDDAFKKSLDARETFAFLPKPFTLPELAAKVKETLAA
ncbi:MAG: ATP-binding protein [Pseudomonadota bacterium]